MHTVSYRSFRDNKGERDKFMLDDANPNPAPGTDPKPVDAGGADPKKTPDTASATFDPSKVSDEEFSKIFDDPRVFQHERFKQLNDQAKKAKAYEEEQQKAKEAKMLEEKKYTELLAEKDAKIQELTSGLQTTTLNSKISAEATKAGAVDPEAVLQLVDRSLIKTDEQGNVTGVDEAVKKLLESKPYLKGTGAAPVVGGESNPSGEGTANLKRFKHSQITNPEFYREHEKEIQASMKAGMIENDL